MTTKAATVVPVPRYVRPPELNDAIKEVHARLADCKTLADAVNAVPAEIAEYEREAALMREELGGAEADLCLTSGPDATRLEQRIDEQNSALNAKEQAVRRARDKLAALERRASALDESVQQAGVTL